MHGLCISEIALLIHALIPHHRCKTRTVCDALSNRDWVQDIHGSLGAEPLVHYVTLWGQLRDISLSDAPDRIFWRWTPNGVYSA